MNIGDALSALWRGEHVARQGWKGRGMWLGLERPTPTSKMTEPFVYMKTADGGFIPWLCSQADLLANDWIVV